MSPEETAESREKIHPCARSITRRAALEWDRHFMGRLRFPRDRLCLRPVQVQEICMSLSELKPPLLLTLAAIRNVVLDVCEFRSAPMSVALAAQVMAR